MNPKITASSWKHRANGVAFTLVYCTPEMTPISKLQPPRLMVLAVMGVDATSMDDWVGEGSPLGERLENLVKSMQALDLAPNLVLWQQGEADARLGTTAAVYGAGFG